MCLRFARFVLFFTSLHSGHPPQLWTIMLRQQLLLPVSLYDWFSHAIWLFNNCAEDMKRTPASSHQCHCQRASVPMATKERQGGKKEVIFFFFCRSLDGTLADQWGRAQVHRRTAKLVRRVQSARSLCFHSFVCVTLFSRVWISTLWFSVWFWSLSPCAHFLSFTLIVCPSFVGITSVLLSFLIKPCFSLLCHVGKSLRVYLSQFFFRRVPNCILRHHILRVTSAYVRKVCSHRVHPKMQSTTCAQSKTWEWNDGHLTPLTNTFLPTACKWHNHDFSIQSLANVFVSIWWWVKNWMPYWLLAGTQFIYKSDLIRYAHWDMWFKVMA